MSVRPRCLLAIGAGVLAAAVCISPLIVRADDSMAHPAIGTQTIGLSIGPFFPIRLLPGQSSKLFGTAAMASWSVTLTDPIGAGWYRGQLSLGAELLGFGTSEPKTAYGIGATPKLEYRFIGLDRLRPYVEGGGGPLWTDLGGRVPEQPGQFNFAVWGGAGCAWLLVPHWSMNVGYRFVHISNAGTRSPNSGLNLGLPLVGLSYSFP